MKPTARRASLMPTRGCMDHLKKASGDGQILAPGRARAGKALVLLVCALLAGSLALTASGCGESGKVNTYVDMANKVLAEVNTKEGELKKYWTLPVFQQEGLNTALADYRKSLAASQAMLDATDFPEPCRQLDDLLGRAVDQGRGLADIDTQFADYFGGLAPLGKQAEQIVSGINKLETSTDVPSAAAGLADQARTLDSQVRTLSPSAQFSEANQQFQAFADLAAKNLTDAEGKVGKTSGYTSPDNQNNSDQQINTDTTGTAPETQSGRQSREQASSISSYTDPIVEEWGTINGELTALLGQVMQSVGLMAKASEVEGYIGQAVQQIKDLEKQYK